MLAVSLQGFTESANKVLWQANERAKELKCDKILPCHVLLGLASIPCSIATNVLDRFFANSNSLKKLHDAILEKVGTGRAGLTMNELPQAGSTKRVIELAREEARNLDEKAVGTEHLLLAFSRPELENDEAVAVLKESGIPQSRIRECVLWVLGKGPYPSSETEEDLLAHQNRPNSPLPARQKWENKLLVVPVRDGEDVEGIVVQRLNEAGEEGWRLGAHLSTQFVSTGEVRHEVKLIVMRPKA